MLKRECPACSMIEPWNLLYTISHTKPNSRETEKMEFEDKVKKIIVIFIIFFVSITITSCSGGTDDSLNSSTSSDTDTTAPILSEVTAVNTPTNDTTPNYTFSSTEEGTITYGGSCMSSTTSASSGNNAITFNTLSNGPVTECVEGDCVIT